MPLFDYMNTDADIIYAYGASFGCYKTCVRSQADWLMQVSSMRNKNCFVRYHHLGQKGSEQRNINYNLYNRNSTTETTLAWTGLAWLGLAWLGLCWGWLGWAGLGWVVPHLYCTCTSPEVWDNYGPYEFPCPRLAAPLMDLWVRP